MELWYDKFFVRPITMRRHFTGTPFSAITCVTMGKDFYEIYSTLGTSAQNKTENPLSSYQSLKEALHAAKRELLEIEDISYGVKDKMNHLVVLDHVDGVQLRCQIHQLFK